MKKQAPKVKVARLDERPKQELPAVLMQDWLAIIRNQICAGREEKEFFAGLSMYKEALTHFAGKLNGMGVTLSPERYGAIVREVLYTIKLKGKLEEIKWMSRYVLHCFQQHWKIHGEGYYEEGKRLRGTVEKSLAKIAGLPRLPDAQAAAVKAPDVVATLAQVNAIVSAPRKRKERVVQGAGKRVAEVVQKELF